MAVGRDGFIWALKPWSALSQVPVRRAVIEHGSTHVGSPKVVNGGWVSPDLLRCFF